jgi:hypothetical protein
MGPTALMLLLLAAAPPERVLVVTYQNLGLEAKQVDELTSAAASAASARLAPVPVEEARVLRRAATMCGEDAPCLATVATQAKAIFALGLGFGKIGKGILVTAVLIDAQGHKLAGGSRKLGADESALDAVRALVAELLQSVPAPRPEPEPVPAPPVSPPLVEDVPRELKLAPGPTALKTSTAAADAHRLRPLAIGATVATGALAIAALVVGLLADSSFSSLPTTAPADRPAADKKQRQLNVAGDACAGAAGALGVTALVLWIVDGVRP